MLGVYLNDKLSDDNKIPDVCKKAKSSLCSLMSAIANSRSIDSLLAPSIISKTIFHNFYTGLNYGN